MSDETGAPKVLNAPDFIWLVYGDLLHDEEHSTVYRDGEVTWCEDSQFASDVLYVRADRSMWGDLKRFLDSAAGEGYEFDGVDAADLYLSLFGDEEAPGEKAEPQCACNDRLASQCPGEWEPGCDLGNNPAHARVAQQVFTAQPGGLLDRFMALAETHGIKSIHDLPGLIPALQATEPVQARQPLTEAEVRKLFRDVDESGVGQFSFMTAWQIWRDAFKAAAHTYGITAAPTKKQTP